MSWKIYFFLIILGLFFLILILNPNLSCFGKRIKSPFYPLLRKKRKKIKTEDYGFKLVDDKEGQSSRLNKQMEQKDSLHLSGKGLKENEEKPSKKKLKTRDYGFSLYDENKRKGANDKEGGQEGGR